MKQKHTQAKKARRASGFHNGPASGAQSRLRALKREASHPKRPKTFGEHVVRIQRILLKKDRFGGPIIRFIRHSKVEAQPQTQE
jgi:hypothetical protein